MKYKEFSFNNKKIKTKILTFDENCNKTSNFDKNKLILLNSDIYSNLLNKKFYKSILSNFNFNKLLIFIDINIFQNLNYVNKNQIDFIQQNFNLIKKNNSNFIQHINLEKDDNLYDFDFYKIDDSFFELKYFQNLNFKNNKHKDNKYIDNRNLNDEDNTESNIFIILSIIDENKKSLNYAEKIFSILYRYDIDKDDFILAIGGGVISDLIGFSASIFRRAIDFGFIPTTILSMIDACFGGKNAVNFNEVKNLIGTITQPSIIVLIPEFLSTLDKKEILSGFAEFVKYLLLDDNFYKQFIHDFSKFIKEKINFKTFSAFPYEKLKEFFIKNPKYLLKALNIKYKFLKDDLFDKNRRQILNLGHTIGHGLELNLKLSHGISLYPAIILELIIVDELRFLNLNQISKIKKTKKIKKKKIKLKSSKIIEKAYDIYKIFKLPLDIDSSFLIEKGFSLQSWLSENNIDYSNLLDKIIESMHQDKKNKDKFYSIPIFYGLKNIKIKKISFDEFDKIFIEKLKDNK